MELLEFGLHSSETLFQLRVVIGVSFPHLDQLLCCVDEGLHLIKSLEEIHPSQTGEMVDLLRIARTIGHVAHLDIVIRTPLNKPNQANLSVFYPCPRCI